MKVKKALSGNFHQQYPANVSAWQPGPDTIQDERSWIGNGKISVVPETFILPALMWVMCGQTANNLNHELFATQNTNYGLEHFSCLHERVSESSPCSKLPAWAPEWLCWSEPGGDQPGPLGCTDCRIPSAGVGHGLWYRVEGVINSHQNPALEQSDELWGIQGRLTESLQELSFSGKAQAMSASLSRNSFPLMHQEASQTMHCQTSESSVYRHSRCQALFSEAVAVQTGGWQKFYHSATCMLTNWHIKPM